MLVDRTTPANSDLLVQSFERKRSRNHRHMLIITYAIWMTYCIATHFMRRADIITLLAWHMDDITMTSMIKDQGLRIKDPWHMDDTQRRCPLLHHCVRRSLEPCCSIPSLGKTRNVYFIVLVLTSALFMPVLGPVLGGNHLPLEDAPAHLVDRAIPLPFSADFAP